MGTVDLSPSAEDIQLVEALSRKGATHRDLVREVAPQTSDEVCDFILWELTPFPFVQGAALLPHLRAAIQRAHTENTEQDPRPT